MKKILTLVLLMFVVFGLNGCQSESKSGELEDFVTAYSEYEVDIEEKPLFSIIDATDGFIFYIDNQKVAIYEYASEADLSASGFEFDAINGRFGLESNSIVAKEIFDAVIFQYFQKN